MDLESPSFVNICSSNVINQNITRSEETLTQYSNVESYQELPTYIRYSITIICAVLLVVGVLGNTLVPIVVCGNRELRNSTNYFLVNLNIADLLVMIVCMPTVLIELHSLPEVWDLGEIMCKLVPFVEMTVAHGSVLTILAISFERYYAICKPLVAGYTCTKMRAIAIIISVWMAATSITSPILLITEYRYATYIDGSEVPICVVSADKAWEKAYFFTVIFLLFFVPLGILVVLYGIIAKRLVTSQRTLATQVADTQIKARKQVILMLAAVVICFFICLIPFRILTLWLLMAPYDQIQDIGMETYYNLLYFCRVMLYLNSAINPILYNLISSRFREAFLRLFSFKRGNSLKRQSTFSTSFSTFTMYGNLKSTNKLICIPLNGIGHASKKKTETSV